MYGRTGIAHDWGFKSYLTGRNQIVNGHGLRFGPLPVNISTIQGCLLGPILFIMYVDDSPNTAKSIHSFLRTTPPAKTYKKLRINETQNRLRMLRIKGPMEWQSIRIDKMYNHPPKRQIHPQ
jgi:hypothetical protein